METEPKTMTLYVVIPPSSLFAAHWSFFLPDRSEPDAEGNPKQGESTKGRRIHVAGDRHNGFVLEIVRGYDVSKHRSVGSRNYPIGVLAERHLESKIFETGEAAGREQKDDEDGGGHIDNRPIDDFERLCVEVEAPGPSLRNASSGRVGEGRRMQKVEVRDCQWWCRQVVALLVERDMLAPLPSSSEWKARTPVEMMGRLPVH